MFATPDLMAMPIPMLLPMALTAVPVAFAHVMFSMPVATHMPIPMLMPMALATGAVPVPFAHVRDAMLQISSLRLGESKTEARQLG
jgi:hypothetical protein